MFNTYVPAGNDADNAVSNGTVHCIGQIKNVPGDAGYGVLAVFTTGAYVMQLYGSISVSGAFRARTRTENTAAWSQWACLN